MKTKNGPETNWQLQDAKNQLSRIVRQSRARGPQTITIHGEPAAVIIAYADFQKLTARKNESLGQYLVKGLRGADLDLSREDDLTANPSKGDL